MPETVSDMVRRLEQGAEQLLEQYNAVVAERDALLNIMQQMTTSRQSPAAEQILETLKKMPGMRQPAPAKPVRTAIRKIKKRAGNKKQKKKAVATEARR